MPVDTDQSRPDQVPSGMTRVGVLSDTHGFLHPAVSSVFKGVNRIIHTGDSESPHILTALARIAPLDPVRGNMDFGPWAQRIPREDMVTVGEVTIYALHDRTRLSLDPEAAGVDVILSGHTHRPEAFRRGTCLYLNPGSASLPRQGRAPSVAIIEINGSQVSYRFVELPDA